MLFCTTLMILAFATPQRVSSFAAKKAGGGGFGTKPVELTYAPDTSDSISGLVTFLKGFGATGINEGVEVGACSSTGRRGVYATKSFKKNKIIGGIPSDCALALSDPNNKEELSTARLGKNFLDMYATNPEAQKAWAPWLNTLPTSSPSDPNFDATPDFWSDEEIAALEHPRAVRVATERKQEIAGLSASSSVDEATLRFAAWIVSSRAYSMAVSEEGGGPESDDDDDDDRPDSVVDEKTGVVGARAQRRALKVLLPYLDLINHSSDNANARIELIDPEKDESFFAIQATRPIAVGKEITIAYGRTESSVELLANHGFVPDENKVDGYVLSKEVDETEGIPDLEGWSTTLEEDLAALETAESHTRQALSLRIKLKRAYKKKGKK